jgi:hypothetical protein
MTRRYDVFNGDADGLCAVQQWRLAHPADAVPVTGPKREIALLARVPAAPGVRATVFDVSLHANRDALGRALAAGVRVRWFDHHFAGEVPSHPGLEASIDTAPGTCTSLIVDRALGHRHARWAAVGAFGDNLHDAARALCARFGVPNDEAMRLAELGEALNHNAYADAPHELLVDPATLRARMAPHTDPLAFVAAEPLCATLVTACRDDLDRVRAIAPCASSGAAAVYRLADAPWARRARGAFGNLLAAREPRRAVAVLAPRADGGFTVSVRVPPGAPERADAFCRRWPGGGGRAIAAGIDRLAPDAADAVERAFLDTYGGDGAPAEDV